MLFTSAQVIKYFDSLDESYLEKTAHSALNELIKIGIIDKFQNPTKYNDATNSPLIIDNISSDSIHFASEQVESNNKARRFSYTPKIISKYLKQGSMHCLFMLRDAPHLIIILTSPASMEPSTSNLNLSWFNELNLLLSSFNENNFDLAITGNKCIGTPYSIYYGHKMLKHKNSRWLKKTELKDIFPKYYDLRTCFHDSLDSENLIVKNFIDNKAEFDQFIRGLTTLVLDSHTKKDLSNLMNAIGISPYRWFGLRNWYARDNLR